MKCINCGNYLTKSDSFCPKCGKEVNKKIKLRIVIQTLLAVIIPFIVLSIIQKEPGYLFLFGAYLLSIIILELTIKTNSLKEGLICNLYSVIFQFGIMIFLSFLEIVAKNEVAGAAPLVVLVLELIYIPSLFVINFIVNLIFGKK